MKPYYPGMPGDPHVDPAEEFMPPAIKPPFISEPPPGDWGTKRWGWGKGRKRVRIYRRPPGKQYAIERKNGYEPVEPSPSPEMHELVEEREDGGLGFLDEIPDWAKYAGLAAAAIGAFMFIRSRKGGKKRR